MKITLRTSKVVDNMQEIDECILEIDESVTKPVLQFYGGVTDTPEVEVIRSSIRSVEEYTSGQSQKIIYNSEVEISYPLIERVMMIFYKRFD